MPTPETGGSNEAPPLQDEIAFDAKKKEFIVSDDSLLGMVGVTGTLSEMSDKILSEAKSEDLDHLGAVAAQEISGIGRKIIGRIETLGKEGVVNEFRSQSLSWYDDHFRPTHFKTPSSTPAKEVAPPQEVPKKEPTENNNGGKGSRNALKNIMAMNDADDHQKDPE